MGGIWFQDSPEANCASLKTGYFFTIQKTPEVPTYFGLTTLGMLATCNCANTELAEASFDPTYYWTGALADQDSFQISVFGTAATATISITALVDTVTVTCSADYSISCGDRELVVVNKST